MVRFASRVLATQTAVSVRVEDARAENAFARFKQFASFAAVVAVNVRAIIPAAVARPRVDEAVVQAQRRNPTITVIVVPTVAGVLLRAAGAAAQLRRPVDAQITVPGSATPA